MIDGFSLGSIVEQMKSDGRSFEEIQSVVREYKRRKDSKPVVDLVGVTIEDKPLEEFNISLEEEEKPNRFIQLPFKNKKGQSDFYYIYEDEYNNTLAQLDDFKGIDFDQYAKNNNLNIQVEDLGDDSLMLETVKKKKDPILEGYKKEIEAVRDEVVPENYEREIIDYIFSGYDENIPGTKKIQKAVFNPFEIPETIKQIQEGKKPPLPADLILLLKEKGMDNITLDDVREKYGENIFNFITKEKERKVDKITGKYKRDLGLTDEMEEKLEFSSLPEDIARKGKDIAAYNQRVKDQYARDLAELEFSASEIEALVGNMVDGGTYKIPFSDRGDTVLDYPATGGFSIGRSNVREAINNKSTLDKDQTPRFKGVDLTGKYQLLRFDREGEIAKYVDQNTVVYNDFVRELDKQQAYINQKSAPYLKEIRTLNTQIQVLESRENLNPEQEIYLQKLKGQKEEALNSYHKSGIKADYDVMKKNIQSTIDYAKQLEDTSINLDNLNLMMSSVQMNHNMGAKLSAGLAEFLAAQFQTFIMQPTAYGMGSAFNLIDYARGIDDPNNIETLLESSQDIYNVAAEYKAGLAKSMSVKDIENWGDIGTYFTQTIMEAAPSILSVLGPAAKFKAMRKLVPQKLLPTAFTPRQILSNKKVLKDLQSANPAAKWAADKYLKIQSAKKATGLSMALFYGYSGGTKLGELEQTYKIAEQQIANINNQLENTTDEVLRQQLLQQLDYYEDAADSSRWQRALTGNTYGAIEMFSEKLGTLSYINGARRINKYSMRTGIDDTFAKGWSTKQFWKNRFKEYGYAGLGMGKNIGIEVMEEIAAQTGHNLMDKMIMGNSKSIMEGVDADLITKSAIISLGLQSPQVLGNINNVIQSEYRTYKDIKENQKKSTRLFEIQDMLSKDNISSQERKQLNKEKKKLQDELAFDQFMTYQKWASMSREEQQQYIEDRAALNFKEKEYYKMIYDPQFGVEGFQQRLEAMEKELIADNEKLGEYLNNKKYKEYKEYTKSLEGSGKMLTNPTIANGMMNLYAAALSLAEHHYQGEVLELKDIQAVNEYIEENNLDEQAANRLRNSYAFVNETTNQLVANNTKVFDSVAGQIAITDTTGKIISLQTADSYERFRAAISPLHELLHMEINSKKVFSDLFPEAKAATESMLNVLGKKVQQGLFPEKVYNRIKNVIDKAYTDENGVVDVDEILTVIGESIIAGDIKQSMFADMHGMKYFLNGLFRKRFPAIAGIMDPFKTSFDMFNFLSDFVNKKTTFGKNLTAVPEEQKEEIKTSAAIDQTSRAPRLDKSKFNLDTLTNEQLIRKLKNAKGYEKQVIEDVLIDAAAKVGLKTMGFDSRAGLGNITYDEGYQVARERVIDRGLLDKFDPRINDNWSTYAGSQLKFDLTDVIERSKKKLDTESTDSELAQQVVDPSTEVVEEAVVEEVEPTIDIFDILPPEVKQEAQEEIDRKIKENNIDLSDANLTFKELQQIAPYETLAKYFGIPVSRITQPQDNLRKGDDISKIQMFILKNVDRLINTRPKGNADVVQTKAVGKLKAKLEGGQSAGIRSRNFLNTEYDKVLDAKGKQKKINNNLQYRIKPGNRNRFLKSSGITNNKVDKNYVPRGPESQYIKGVLELLARNMALAGFGQAVDQQQDQAVQEQTTTPEKAATRKATVRQKTAPAKAPLLKFSKPVFSGTTDTWKNILENAGITPIDMKTDDGRKQFKAWLLKPGVSKSLPEVFWRNYGTFTGTTQGLTIEELGIIEGKYIEEYIDEEGLPAVDKFDVTFFEDGKTKRLRTYAGNFAFLNNEQVEAIVDQMIDFAKEDTDIAAAVSKDSYTKIETKLNDETFNDKQDKKLKGLYKIFKAFEGLMKEDKANIPFVAALLSSTSAYQGHFVRTSAPIRFYSIDKTGGLTEEHTLPASMVAKYLFIQAANQTLNKDTYKGIENNYFQGGLRSYDDKKLKGIGVNGVKYNYVAKAPEGWTLDQTIWLRYFNPNVANTRGGIDPNSIMLRGNQTAAQVLNLNVKGQPTTPALNKAQVQVAPKNNKKQPKISQFSKSVSNETVIDNMRMIDKALDNARDINAETKGISIYDFDDTLAFSKSKIIVTMPDGKTKKITPAEFAVQDEKLKREGAEFDFSEFTKVVKGKPGPLVPRLRKAIKKFGNENIFVLTARPQASAQSIYDFLKAIGVELPLDNIVGLEDGRPQAKANWVISKAAEGYNDFYFVDDAVKNVKAVAKVLEQVDVNSKVQQAKIRFSKSLDREFNAMIEGKTGIGMEKEYSPAKAQVVGSSKGKFKFFIPPSADDFVGLMYYLLGKGKTGDAQMAWIKTHLLDPYARAMASISLDRISMQGDYNALKEKLGIVPRNLKKKMPGEDFTVEQAVRVYIWNKQGMNIPGLSKTDLKELTDYITSNNELQVFADSLIDILKGEKYNQPKAGWLAGTITTDLVDTLDTAKRAKYLEQWQKNVDIIFSDKNMNKLEAAFGRSYRLALEDMLKRMKSGRNRGFSGDSLTGRFTDWLTNSIGTIMFFNTRSALLQTISAANFINFSDNNILAAGKAFADQKQYWKDFLQIMNSPFLKERRGGLRFNVNESDIADMAREGGPRAIISKMLAFGFLPTQIADSFAIASGGATFYRNRINTYLKQGMDQKAAEEQAFLDFREIAEESQQSSRPDRISQQQAGPLGRIILAFANTPMQYNRLIGKAISDLKNGRGDWRTNVSKIMYYSFVQNLIFNALQQALFAIAFGDSDEEEENEKTIGIANGMADSLLRGLGFGGAAVSVVKNAILRGIKESKKKNPNYDKIAYELGRLSPPISSKLSRINQANRSFKYDLDKMKSMGFDIQNPAILAIANYISASFNIPLDRAIKKMINIDDAFSQDLAMWERMALLGGWSSWEIGIDKDETTKKSKNKLRLRSGLKIKGTGLKIK